MDWIYYGLILVAAFALVGLAERYYNLRDEARFLRKDLLWANEHNRRMQEQIDELLKTRRRATRERYLGIIEEHRTPG